MKKIIAICLLLVMALGLCACGNKNVPDRFYGVWKTADGTVTLTLNTDGTAEFVDTVDGHTYTFLWTAENNANITIKWDGEPPVADQPVETQPVAEETEVVEGQEGTENGSTTARRDDPSIVGYGSMTVSGGKMLMALNEGSSTDPILFVYNATNKKTLIKVA